MLYFRTHVDRLLAVSMIIAAVYLDPVSKITLNIRIAVELDLILAVLIKRKTIVIELVSPFLGADHLAVELEFTLVVDIHKAVSALEICMPLMILGRKITVVDHVETHDGRFSLRRFRHFG